MLSKLKYIFLDFSDDFKRDFISTLKKSVIFLIIGIVTLFISDSSGAVSLIKGLSFLIFGLFWCRDLVAALTAAVLLPKNIMIKLVLLLALYVVCLFIGYIYFLWCIVKMVVILIKPKEKKDNRNN